MSTYRELTAAGTTTSSAATLTGISRATAARQAHGPNPVVEPVALPVPANKLDPAERARVRRVLNSPRFVDLAPLQVYAQLLDEGTYLCSVSTMYRVLGEACEVKKRRRLARHPARVCPELLATAPCQVYSGAEEDPYSPLAPSGPLITAWSFDRCVCGGIVIGLTARDLGDREAV